MQNILENQVNNTAWFSFAKLQQIIEKLQAFDGHILKKRTLIVNNLQNKKVI